MAEETTSSSVLDNTCIIVVNFHAIGDHRSLATESLTTAVDASWIRASKIIFKSETLKKLHEIKRKVAEKLEREGVRFPLQDRHYLIPNTTECIHRVVKALQDFKAEWDALVAQFIEEYPKLIEQAKAQLRDEWNAYDYPSSTDLPRKFGFTWQFLEFQTPTALKRISQTIYEEELKKAQEKASCIEEMATQAIREEFAELLKHFREQLTGTTPSGKPKRLTKPAMQRMHDWMHSFEQERNIAHDDLLQELVGDFQACMHGYDTKMIKENESLRTYLADTCKELQSDLHSLMEDKPTRVFHF